MISLAVTLLLSHVTSRLDDPITVIASEDVWVYPNSSDPGADETFKIWGIEGKAVAPKPDQAENFGYGYLKFDFSAAPAGKKLVSAFMVLKPVAKMTVDKNAKDYPLEVRPLVGKFAEKTFEHGMTSSVYPGDSIYGTGVVAPVVGSTDEKDLEIRVDLMAKKSQFAEMFGKSAKGDKVMFFALTSKYDAAELGRDGIYRIYTRDRKEENMKPKIVLKFE
jgi:hypothetical protein